MNTLHANGLAFVAMLVSLPLIAFGSTEGPDALWVAGLGVLGAAHVVPTATRWLGDGDGDGDGDDNDHDEQEEA